MAVTPEGHRALEAYVAQAAIGGPANTTVWNAVILTDAQVAGLAEVLSAWWGRPYPCPRTLDIKPRHGYNSRVVKDDYPAEQYVLWLVAACSDVAEVATDPSGRPRLIVPAVSDEQGRNYSLIVPVHTDSHGHVHVDDVIPKGLPPRHKKQSPRRIPKTVPKDAERRGL